jgi:broad specificity phosphatase PhoE
MRELVVLRHSLTRKGVDRRRSGSHLSSAGVRLARAVGDTLPAMTYVAVGDQPRHVETSIALGFAVDELVSWPSGYVTGEVDHHDQWSWDRPFERYAELLAMGRGLADVAQVHLGHWLRILEHIPDEGSGLVVSSGGSIEPVLVTALPSAHHGDWGGPLHQLEGAALTWDGSEFAAIRLLRLDGDHDCQL